MKNGKKTQNILKNGKIFQVIFQVNFRNYLKSKDNNFALQEYHLSSIKSYRRVGKAVMNSNLITMQFKTV